MLLKAENVCFAYDTVQIFNNLNFHLEDGQTCALIGPSGCGKSTLLYLTAGLLRQSSGSIHISDLPTYPQHPDTAIILQDYGLLPWKTVMNNLSLGMRFSQKHFDAKKSHSLAQEMLEYLGLSETANRYPHQLSGGQRQRVAIGRALLQSPRLLLMDEPFSAIDTLTRENLQQFLLNSWKERDLSLLFVTHSIEEAVFLGQKIVVLSRAPAEIAYVIDNPHMGMENHRSQAVFHQLCSDIREKLAQVT